MADLQLKPHKTQPTTQPTQPEPEAETPAQKGVILLFGRGTVQYDQGKFNLIVLTAIQPHPLREAEDWLQFMEHILRDFSIARVKEVVVAVEKAQVPTAYAMISKLGRRKEKFHVARVEVKDGKFVYFPY